jgi:acylphosphatase
MAARRFIVRGRVQGVGYRYFAVSAARSAGVTGTVRNLSDGSVEAIAEGSPSELAVFRLQLEKGPAFSRVTSVDEQELQPTNRYSDFNVSY